MKKATLITPLYLGYNLSRLTKQLVEKVFPVSSELSQMALATFTPWQRLVKACL